MPSRDAPSFAPTRAARPRSPGAPGGTSCVSPSKRLKISIVTPDPFAVRPERVDASVEHLHHHGLSRAPELIGRTETGRAREVKTKTAELPLRGQRAGVGDAEPDPFRKLPLGADVRRVDTPPAPHLPP